MKSIKYNKTYMLITPQEIKNRGEIMPNYINNKIFRQILDENGWTQIEYMRTGDYSKLLNEGLGFIYITGDCKYNMNIYNIPVYIKNLFEYKSHRQITNKYNLYVLLTKYLGKDVTNYIAESWKVDKIEELPKKTKDDVFIVRPIEGYEGYGIENIKTDKELKRIQQLDKTIKKQITSKTADWKTSKVYSKGMMISRYFMNPLLFKGKKFHLRTYLMIKKYVVKDRVNWTWSFFNRGKILTAADEYVNNEWDNKKIHDTHIGTTDDDYYFPEDLDIMESKKLEILDSMNYISRIVFNIIKESNIRTFDEAVNSFEVLGLDFMILDDYSVKILEINNKLGYGVKNQGTPKVEKFTRDFFEWIYKNAIKPIENNL